MRRRLMCLGPAGTWSAGQGRWSSVVFCYLGWGSGPFKFVMVARLHGLVYMVVRQHGSGSSTWSSTCQLFLIFNEKVFFMEQPGPAGILQQMIFRFIIRF
jgi:hypothetical protein